METSSRALTSSQLGASSFVASLRSGAACPIQCASTVAPRERPAQGSRKHRHISALGGISAIVLVRVPPAQVVSTASSSGIICSMAKVKHMRSNNAFERTVGHRGPRLAAARAAWPAAQRDR